MISQTKQFSELCERIISHKTAAAKTGSHGFAVFVNKSGELSAMHLTDRRRDLITRDLDRAGPILNDFVGAYTKNMSPSAFASDIEYVLQQHEKRGKKCVKTLW